MFNNYGYNNYSTTPQNGKNKISFTANFNNNSNPNIPQNLTGNNFPSTQPIQIESISNKLITLKTSNNTNNIINIEANLKNSKQPAKEEYVEFKVNLENILSGKDKRTTLMLRNIPNKYSLQNLVDELNSNALGKYDYINLPIDYERKLNLGYGFINFLDPLYIVSFHEFYLTKKWQKYKSDKKIDLNYAEKQGKKDVNNKDENTYFATNKKGLPRIEIPAVIFFNIFLLF